MTQRLAKHGGLPFVCVTLGPWRVPLCLVSCSDHALRCQVPGRNALHGRLGLPELWVPVLLEVGAAVAGGGFALQVLLVVLQCDVAPVTPMLVRLADIPVRVGPRLGAVKIKL